MTAAILGKGTVLQIAANGVDFVTIAELNDLTFNVSTDEVDATSHDTPGDFKEVIAGLRTTGLNADANLIQANGTHWGPNSVFAAAVAGAILPYKVLFASGKNIQSSLLITNFEIKAPVGDKLNVSFTMTGSGGAPTISA